MPPKSDDDAEQSTAEDLARRLLALGRDCASRLEEPLRSAEHGDLLYDENAVPA
jgi:hypothetical protein